MTKIYRQGDILFITEENKTESENTTSSLEIAKGEATGHAHVLEGVQIAFRRDYQDAVNRVGVPFGGVLRHEEHAPIELPPGSYQVRRQREYGYNDAVQVDD